MLIQAVYLYPLVKHCQLQKFYQRQLTSTPFVSPVASTSKSSKSISEPTNINTDNQHSYSEIENFQDKVILTKQLFSDVINVSPEQLNDAEHNDLEKT